MDEQQKQETLAFLQTRLGARCTILNRDFSATEAEDFLVKFSDCLDLHDVQSVIASLKQIVLTGVSLRLPCGHHDYMIAVRLNDECGLCLSIQTGTAMLAELAVAGACEAWSLTCQLNRANREQAWLSAGVRLDGPHESAVPPALGPHSLGHGASLETLRAMCGAIDARDRYTHGHSERVAAMAFQLARQLGISTNACHEIYLAGLLHDIGKIGTPDAVLLKEGALTEEEFAVIRRHPEIGYRIVERLSELSFALPGILHHHERWDGGGYPHGLAGESTPLMARILSVADAFDAMTSSRVYRKAMPLSRALAIIDGGRGVQWDAAIVDCLTACVSEAGYSSTDGSSFGSREPVEYSAARVPQMLPQSILAQHSSVELMYQAIMTLGH